MRGQHANFCCGCTHKPHHVSPLEVEGLKKQLGEAYAMLHFLQKNRSLHRSPQNDAELVQTNNLIQKLIDAIGLHNQKTPSKPQMNSQGTQTDKVGGGTQAEAGTQTTPGPSEAGTQTTPGTSEAGTQTPNRQIIPVNTEEDSEELELKKINLISYYIGEGQDTEEQIKALEDRIGNMTEEEIDAELEDVDVASIPQPIIEEQKKKPRRFVRPGQRRR